MSWCAWWVVVAVALRARGLAQAPTPTICQDQACHCDAFTRVICNCTGEYDEVTLRPDGAYRVPPLATGIIVDGCARAVFLTDTIRELVSLRVVEIRNVGNVLINERALAWTPFDTDHENNPGIRITIHNSTVNEISSHAIRGRVDSIQITNSRLKEIRAFAFSSLMGVTNVELINNDFINIIPQAFKKFTMTNFLLQGGYIKTLPSRFLSDIDVTNRFQMQGVTVNYIKSLAFLVSMPQRILIESNSIMELEGDGFRVTSRGPIAFRNNTIMTLKRGAFLGFSAHSEVTSMKGRQELVIDNNTMTSLTPDTFLYDRASLTMHIDGLNLNASCSCALADEWRTLLHDHGGSVNCWYPLEGYFMSLPTFVDRRCGAFKQTFWIFIIVGIIILLIIVSILIFYIVRRENEKKKKVQIVMPDCKTYKETEFHIVVERAELLTTDL